jgi:hypothetical protein
VEQSPFTLLRDDDITDYVAPNVSLMDDFLKSKLKPASESISRYLQSNSPLLTKIGALLFRKTFSQLDERYLAHTPNQSLLNGSSRYQFIVLQLIKPV